MKKASLILSVAMMTAMMMNGCGGGSGEVTIGKQVWMAKNLDVDKFRNGDPIPHAKTGEEWEKAGKNEQPAWCYYDNDPANGERYGKLYSWYAVNDSRGLAPEGWKIPSDEDWSRLTDFLGGEPEAGIKMKFTDFWGDKSGNGTNESGFAGLPVGDRYYDGTFGGRGRHGNWWSYTEYSTSDAWAWYRVLFYSDGDVGRDNTYKRNGFPDRCLRD